MNVTKTFWKIVFVAFGLRCGLGFIAGIQHPDVTTPLLLSADALGLLVALGLFYYAFERNFSSKIALLVVSYSSLLYFGIRIISDLVRIAVFNGPPELFAWLHNAPLAQTLTVIVYILLILLQIVVAIAIYRLYHEQLPNFSE